MMKVSKDFRLEQHAQHRCHSKAGERAVKDNSYSKGSNMKSIRREVFDLWVENPYLTAKKICSLLELNYRRHGNYLNRLLSEFRSYYDLGSALKAQLPHKRVFVWKKVGGSRTRALESGWMKSANRNGMLVFRDAQGSVHWYKGGLVRLYLRGAVQLAWAKELFCRAFSWFSDEQLCRFLDVPLREESRHWVFELDKPVSRFDIRKFKRSHGIRIFADKSHTTAVEIEESQPFWIGELRETVELFGLEIREHLKLIREWQKEARGNRIQESTKNET